MILLGILMPIMGGLEMLQELQKNDWGREVPIIILSNLSSSENIEESLKKNVYGYFVKSDWNPDDLVELISKKLKKIK
jgi:DNA-binding NarL/FixJ family response regulator